MWAAPTLASRATCRLPCCPGALPALPRRAAGSGGCHRRRSHTRKTHKNRHSGGGGEGGGTLDPLSARRSGVPPPTQPPQHRTRRHPHPTQPARGPVAGEKRSRRTAGKAPAAAGHDSGGAVQEGGEGEPGADTASTSGQLNWMRGALLAADALATVSPGYAREVVAPEMGCGMHEIIAARGITGIMNGIDTCEWDPARDPLLPEQWRYGPASAPACKAAIKCLLQRQLGLEENPAAPLVGFVGRLTEQKGLDVLLGAAPALLARPGAAPRPSTWQPPATAAAAAAAAADSALGQHQQQSTQPALTGVPDAAEPGLQLVVLGTGEVRCEGLRGRGSARAVSVPRSCLHSPHHTRRHGWRLPCAACPSPLPAVRLACPPFQVFVCRGRGGGGTHPSERGRITSSARYCILHADSRLLSTMVLLLPQRSWPTC